jgi:cell division protein FtsL
MILFLNLILLLLVATTSVERAYSTRNLVKNKPRNKMSDNLLDDCLAAFIERDFGLSR